jgi:hypothetical protein
MSKLRTRTMDKLASRACMEVTGGVADVIKV